MSTGDQMSQPRQRVPFGLLGAIVLMAVVECAVERNAIVSQGGSHWSCRIAMNVAATEAKSNQIFYFGDSLLRLGLAPRVIEAETGLQGYNFAQTGGQAPGSYFLLRRAIDAGARPAAVVVDFFPALLRLNTSFNDENWPFLANLSEGFNLAAFQRDPSAFAGHALRLALPSARSRTSLRIWTYYCLQPNPQISISDEVRKSIRNWQVNRGAEITLARPDLVENLGGWEQGYFASFRCLPIHEFYIKQFLDLAAEHQIPVFWLLPPYQPQLQARTERSGFERDHEAFIKRFLALYPNLAILDARHSQYPSEVFHDLHHLGEPGAAVLSADVGNALQQSLDAPGRGSTWIGLPRFQARPASAPLETTDVSRVLVQQELRQERLKTRFR